MEAKGNSFGGRGRLVREGSIWRVAVGQMWIKYYDVYTRQCHSEAYYFVCKLKRRKTKQEKNIWTTSLQCQKYVHPRRKNCCPGTQLLSRFCHLHASWSWCLSYFKPVASDISFFLKSVNIKWQVKSHIDSITWLKFEAGAQRWPEVPRFHRESWITAFRCVCV